MSSNKQEQQPPKKSKYGPPKPVPVGQLPSNLLFDSARQPTVEQPNPILTMPSGSASTVPKLMDYTVACSSIDTTAAARAADTEEKRPNLNPNPSKMRSSDLRQASPSVTARGAPVSKVAIDSAVHSDASSCVATTLPAVADRAAAGLDQTQQQKMMKAQDEEGTAALLNRLTNFQGLPPNCIAKNSGNQATKPPGDGAAIATVESGIGSFLETGTASSTRTVSASAASVPQAQEELRCYQAAATAAVHCLAFTGSSDQAMRLLLSKCPQVLLTVDHPRYQESPLGQALLRGNADWARAFLAVADAKGGAGLVDKVLSHRNSARHTLLILAVDLLDAGGDDDCANAKADKELLERLLAHRPSQVHECYDAEGRNVLHHCAADCRPAALRCILDWLARNAPDSASNVAAALRMPDGRFRTPLHYMAECGSIDMLAAVADFAAATGVKVDFDSRWRAAFDRTPLMLAAAGGHFDACQWLLTSGGADPTVRAGDTGETALAMAKEASASSEELLCLLAAESGRGKGGGAAEGDDSFDDEDQDEEDADCGFEDDDNFAEADDEANNDEVKEEMEEEKPTVATAAPKAQEKAKAAPAVASGRANDLGQLSAESRARLCQRLRDTGNYDKFLDLLKARVPDLAANQAFLDLSVDPVLLSISLMAGGASNASCSMLNDLLAEVELPNLMRDLQLAAPPPSTIRTAAEEEEVPQKQPRMA